MLVLYASAAIDVVLRTARGDRVTSYLDSGEVLHAPDFLWLEVASALRRAVRIGACTPSRAVAALDDLAELSISVHNDFDLVARAFELRDELTVYDAAYVAPAETLGARLLTCDRGKASVADRTCDVVLVD